MSKWFDDFMAMKILEDDSTSEEEEVDTSEMEEALEALQDELSLLQDELLTLECNEPDDGLSDAHVRWEARYDLLADQISDVEIEIEELEETLRG